MNRKVILIGLFLAAVVAGGLYYGTTMFPKNGTERAGQTDAGHKEGTVFERGGTAKDDKVIMAPGIQAQNGVVLGLVKKQQLIGTISATGKVEANGDRSAHISPVIPSTIVGIKVSLGDRVAIGQVLATLESGELVDMLNRYHQSKSKLKLAQSMMERVNILWDKKIVARKEVRQAESDLAVARADFLADRRKLALSGVDTVELDGGKERMPLFQLRSPIAGIVTEKHATRGERAEPSKILYTVADLSSVWIELDINEKDLEKVRRGQRAVITLAAYPGMKLTGRVAYIADLMDQNTHTVKARIEAPNVDRKLKPEMLATVELALDEDAPPVLVIPEEAIQELDGRKVVFVAEKDGEFTPRPVQSGRVAAGMVEIVSGLKEGDSCAFRGAFILKSELKKREVSDEH